MNKISLTKKEIKNLDEKNKIFLAFCQFQKSWLEQFPIISGKNST